MSRRAKALTAAAFAYLQWIVTAFVGFYLTRFLVRSLGKDLYGLWLGTGAFLAYAALADLGILGVLPWLVAEADGEKSEEKMRRVVANGAVASVVAGVLYGVSAMALWLSLPRLAHLSASDYQLLRGPILWMTGLTAVGFPLRLFGAIRTGLQDYKFAGTLSTLQAGANAILVVALAREGHALYGVALGSALPPLAIGILHAFRTRAREPWMLRAWPRISWESFRPVLSSGLGTWMSSLGWQLAAASDTVIIAFLGHRTEAPTFVVTGKLGLMLMQMAWVIPDSASVGLAQLNAEGNRERVREIVSALVKLHLLLAGVIACVVLAANLGFVQAWVGLDLFGGARLNGMIALDVISLSIAHAVVTPVAVLGQRTVIGVLTLANGAAHVVFALLLGNGFGLVGIAAATVLSALVTTIPAGAWLLARRTELRPSAIWRDVVSPWLARTAPCAAVALAAGWVCMRTSLAATSLGQRIGPLLVSLATGGVLAVVYMFSMRTVTRDLPFGPRLRRLLSRLRLVA